MHEDGLRALEALGRPAVMVIPHRRHQMDAPFYRQRYPQLRVLAADPSRVQGVAVDGGLSELSEHGIEAYVLPGNTYEDVVMDIRLADGHALTVCESCAPDGRPSRCSPSRCPAALTARAAPSRNRRDGAAPPRETSGSALFRNPACICRARPHTPARAPSMRPLCASTRSVHTSGSSWWDLTPHGAEPCHPRPSARGRTRRGQRCASVLRSLAHTTVIACASCFEEAIGKAAAG